MSKYKERAIEILDEQDILGFLKLDDGMDEEVIDAMCELAEEVENECAETLLNSGFILDKKDGTLNNHQKILAILRKELYTKEQVDELKKTHQHAMNNLIEIFEKTTIPLYKVELLLTKQRELCAEKWNLPQSERKEAIRNSKLNIKDYE